MKYVLAVQAPVFRASADAFCVERPFAVHLNELRIAIGDKFSEIILVAPHMSMSDRSPADLQELSTTDGIRYIPSHDNNESSFTFWMNSAIKIYKTTKVLFEEGAVLHADLSTDIQKPMTAIVARAALVSGSPVCFVTDIDFRSHTERAAALGNTNFLRSVRGRIQEHFKRWQVERAVSSYDLILLKSASMVADFGKGKGNVKNFYDTVHSVDDIIDSHQLMVRSSQLSTDSEMRLCYFGRLVEYKGIDRAIEAVNLARERGVNATLKIVGDGPSYERLRQQAARADPRSVTLVGPAKYGQELFSIISDCHFMIASPLREDTPRAAFDAFARGLPIIAFDISYFRDLAAASNAVILADWPKISSLADRIVEISNDRASWANRSQHAIQFARDNTQAAWLKKRADWIEQYLIRKKG